MSGQDWDWEQFAANMQQFGQNMRQFGQRTTINAGHLQVGSNNFQSFGGGNIYFHHGYTPFTSGNTQSSSSTFSGSGNVRFVSTGDGQVFINGRRVHPTNNSTTPGSSSSTSSTFNRYGGHTEVFVNGQRVHPTTSTSTSTASSSSTTTSTPNKPSTSSSTTSKMSDSKTEKSKRRPECKNVKKSSRTSNTCPRATKPSAPPPPQESSDDEFYDAMQTLP